MESTGEIVMYQTADGKTSISVKLENETVWLSQLQLSELFGQTKQNISLHLNNLFKERELSRRATIKGILGGSRRG
jgi:hypothetical protein